MNDAAQYWDERARRFAAEGDGLAAVCSYGMPSFYNRSIELCQERALRNWLRPAAGVAAGPRPRALDVGCGVGRWSLRLADRGYAVTGIDVSPYMIERARGRAHAARADCSFAVADLRSLDLGLKFDLILCVTVLQHLREPEEARDALGRLATHLAPGGALVALEAAPSTICHRCDTPVFTARSFDWYLDAIEGAGLTLESIGGVDPMPCKTWLLPHYRSLPRALAVASLAVVTLVSLPVDWALGGKSPQRSWHKVFAARHASQEAA
jgi:2-polyprenyl-3-methyl-5-hydroxy-6-metoxy-1,4-benzoquinol methylase